MTSEPHAPRSVVVIDVGATNIDIVQYSENLDVIARKTGPAKRYDGPFYSYLDAEDALEFAKPTILDFDQTVPVDAIVPCTHGSALAALDDHGALVLPIMSYLNPVPEPVAQAYAAMEPPFSEVFAPTNPGALTLARQVLWFEMLHPDDYAKVSALQPYAQYIAFRLSGAIASEMTSLGAQSHLWAPQETGFSALAKSRGWADLIPPIVPAGEVLGRAHELSLRGRGMVHCGIHDSSASYLQFAHLEPIVLLSTGTWIIAFDSGAELASLDPSRDQVANVKIDGKPIASARFMGGEEFKCIAGQDNDAEPNVKTALSLIAEGVMALPSFTDSGGPIPETGGRGKIVGKADLTNAERVSLATLYTAMMTAFALDHLGDTQRVVVDGVFAKNEAFMALFSALLPEREVFKVQSDAGSARGAALLALPSVGAEVELVPAPKPTIEGLAQYYTVWLDRAGETSIGERNAH